MFNSFIEHSFIFSTNQNTCTQVAPFLEGKKILVTCFDAETETDLTDWIHEAGGDLVDKNFPGIVDYAIVPINVSPSLKLKANEIVTNFWIEGDGRYQLLKFKMGHTQPLFRLFKQILQFLQQINEKNLHPVCSAGNLPHINLFCHFPLVYSVDIQKATFSIFTWTLMSTLTG